jgi:predicted nuclease of predicted toxin-antitoxin system
VRFGTGWLAPANRRILEYAAAHGFILVSTDSDFERLLRQIPGAKVVILRSCDYPTEIAAEVLRRNAIRIAELPHSQDHLIVLDQ